MSQRVPYRRLFLAAAWAHLLVGVVGLVTLPAYFRPLGVPPQRMPLFWQAACATTACFGLAGFWIARDARRNTALIQLWLIVKAASVVLVLWNLRVAGLRPPAGLVVVLDVVWIALFTSALVRLTREPSP